MRRVARSLALALVVLLSHVSLSARPVHAQDAAASETGGTTGGVAAAGVAGTEDAPGASAASPREPTEAELADAHHSFEVGTSAYTGGDYETAAEEFRAAYEITRHPELLFNVYLAEERAGRPAEAAAALGQYLEDATTIAAEERPLLERRLERLRARAASRTMSPPAAEELDDSALLASPIEGPPSAGEGGAAARVARPSDRDAPASRGTPSTAGIALLVTAGVLLASFAVLAPLSEVEDQRLASSCGRDAGRSCASGDTGTLMALNLAADVSWITATVAGVFGLVLVLVMPSEGAASSSGPAVALAPWASPTGAGIAAGGTF